MTKTTKVIAALGVVAGLGVAALPLTSYAAEISGDVKVEVKINDSIAMKIHSNADEVKYTAVENPTGNPSELGYFEKSGDVYIASTDTTVDSEKTYYTQSGAEFGFWGVNPDGTNASDDILAAGPSQATGLQMAGNQFDYSTLYSDIYVRSNTGSFKLVLQDADEDNDLDLETPSTDTGKFIPAVEGTNKGLVRTTAGWGYYVGTPADATAANGNIWNEVPKNVAGTDAATIVSAGTNSVGSYSNAIHVSYGVASGATSTGTYSDVITYTATAL